MGRIQFIELHEQSWFPSSIRDEITDTLQFGLNLLNVYAPIAPLLRGALDSVRNRTKCGHSNSGQAVVDLCSGGGGPWPELAYDLASEPWSDLASDFSRRLPVQTVSAAAPAVQVRLTDIYPNLDGFQRVGARSQNHITYYSGSVNAMAVPGELKGFRTMFTSFHHFSPREARAILQNAVDAGEGIGIFEITRRSPSTIILVVAWVLMLFVCTPWIRPFRWSRLLWTYVVPIIPLVLLFDGVVSCLRTYRPRELRAMVRELEASHYRWEIGEQGRGTTPITYLIGYPRVSLPEFAQ